MRAGTIASGFAPAGISPNTGTGRTRPNKRANARDEPNAREPAAALFALLEERLEHRGKFLSFGGVRIDLVETAHNFFVIRAKLLAHGVGFCAERLQCLLVLFLF